MEGSVTKSRVSQMVGDVLNNLTIEESPGNCSCSVSEVELWAKFLLEEVSIPVVGSVGLVGNLAAIVVLSHPDMKSTFHQSLITLAVFEILFLILVICDHGLNIKSELYIVMIPHFLYPLKNILMSCESYLLMSIALERLIAVARPLWYRNASLRLSSWRHGLVFVHPALIISVGLNIPKFFELQLFSVNVTDSNNVTRELRDFEVTRMRLNPDYIYYYIHWTRSLGTGVFPILFLLVTNISIYFSLKRQRSSPSLSISSERHESVALANLASTRKFSVFSELLRLTNARAEINGLLTQDQIIQNSKSLTHSAVTLTAIVMMYIVCNLPRLVVNLAESLYQSHLYQDYAQCACVSSVQWLEVSVRLNHFLLTINSSANFIIYWSVGKKFQSTLCRRAKGMKYRIQSCFSWKQ